MNAHEVIAKHLFGALYEFRTSWERITPFRRAWYRTKSLSLERALNAAGFVILPRSEVDAIRDKALEEAAAWRLLTASDFHNNLDNQPDYTKDREHQPRNFRRLFQGREPYGRGHRD